MAATVSAWALDSEENEDELLQQRKQDTVNGNHISNGDSAAPADFPSLAAAASKPKKKKGGQTLSLQEFTTFGNTAKMSKGSTPDELLSLPTGPRQRSAEELDRTKLGGGFRSYGNNYDRPSRDEQPRRQRDSSRDFAPSRADEIDDWGAAKKSTVGNRFERRERGERGGVFSDSQSRADEVDNWASNKTFVPSNGRRNDRRGGGFESNGGGADSANWAKRKEEEGRKFGGGWAFDSLRDRRGGGFDYSANGARPDADSWGRKREEGTTTTGGRPRLNLRPRTLPVDEQTESIVKPKGPSPFGDARPREEVLKEKGQDWKEIDEKLESDKVKEAAAAVEEKPAFGKRGFGSGSLRGSSRQEDRNERTWRKPESQQADSPPPSAEKTEDVPVVEEAEDKDSEI